jgi:hypothetical protein
MSTDAILQDILDEIRRQGGTGGGGAGGGGGSGGSGPIDLRVAKAVWGKASQLIGTLGTAASTTAGGLLDLANTARDGSAGLSEVTGFFASKLPASLGIFGQALTMAAGIAEKNLAVQQELSQSGATFGGSLTLMREAAGRSYLGLDQFAGVVKKNSDIFATMGGNVENGVQSFAKIQKQLLAPGSETSAMLSAMGVSSQEAADLTASYMRSQGSMNKAQLQDQKAVAVAVTQYASELTLLSQITGKSREEIKAKMDAETQEAQFKAYLASLAPEEANKLRQGLQNSMAQGGQGAVDAFKAMAMGFPPMTEAGQMYAATQRQGMETLKGYNDRAKDAGISTEKNAELNRAALAKQIAGGAQDMAKLQKVLQADALAGGTLSKSFAEAQNAQTAFMKDGKMMSEKEIASKLAEMDAANKKKETEAKTVAEAQRGFQELTNSILAKVMPALNFLLGGFVKGADFLGKLLLPAFDKLNFKPLTDFFDNVFKKFDWATLTGTLSKTMTSVFEVITTVAGALEPLFMQIVGLVNSLMPKLLPIIQDIGTIVTRIAEVVGPLLAPLIDGVGIVIGGLFNMFGGLVKIIKGLVTGDFGEVFTGIGDVLGGFFQRLYGILKIFKDLAVGGVRAIWNFLSGGTPAAAPAEPTTPATKGSGGSSTPSDYPMAATGGIFSGPKSGYPIIAHGTEAIVPLNKGTGSDALQALGGGMGGSSENVAVYLQTLNNVSMEMLKYMKETAEYTRRNVDATKQLGGNLFPTV